MVHFGEVHHVGAGQGFAVDFAAADDEDLLVGLPGQVQGFGEGVGHFAAGRGPVELARHHDVAALGQRPADAVVSAAAHHDGVSQGEGLEVAQVGGQVPGQLALLANHAVVGNGDDDGNHISSFRLTATSGQLFGCLHK